MVRLASLLFAATASASAVLNLIPSNFDEIVFQSGKPALVEFFAPWCGHCKNLAPVYDELAASFGSQSSKVSIANVDADAHKALGKRFGVQGFPTLKWFDGKPGSEPVDYNGGRDLESLQKFVTEKSGVKPKGAKKTTSHVQILDEKSFKEQVGKDNDVLVAFTAPWCGHCKTLKPTWEKLAEDFAAEPNVIIAQVDAEAENSKSLAQEQGISGFPTIKFFPKGSAEPSPYAGARSEEAFIEYLNEKTGVNRMIGGKLNTKAGTIAALDSILAKYITPNGFSDVEKASAELTKAAKDVSDKTKEYYLKALAKLTGNPEYAMKEQTRLAGLLKKSGLAPEKIDDLQRRSNILAKFLVKDGESGDVRDEL
ncbi:hypothetical protein LTR05_006300 [Lithohypha guttulata]|uniref:protein disulfide-isomerase n=1 Tax=Lithohypha guttulata TaxID=1690604 RepID=A0AAN7YEW2_9EURO|nr:hypothetical protein LTR05_006300 [Lithohypha guttulata]